MTIAELIRRLKVQCQDDLDLPVEIQDSGGQEFLVDDIYYESRGPLVIVEVK